MLDSLLSKFEWYRRLRGGVWEERCNSGTFQDYYVRIPKLPKGYTETGMGYIVRGHEHWSYRKND